MSSTTSRLLRIPTLAVAALALGLLAAPPQGGIALGGAPAMAQSNYSDGKLASFIEAALAVNRIRDQWMPQIQGAGSESEAESMIQQANQQMVAAVDRTVGITMQEYLQIVEAADNDPALSEKLGNLYQQKVGN